VSYKQEALQLSRKYRRRLYYVAYHDSLTGLPNRLCLKRRLAKLLRTTASTTSMTAALHIDIDNFKAVSDSTSRGSGDRLLRAIAKRLRAAVSSHDIVARLSGDEFAVIVGNLGDADAVEKLVTRLCGAIEAPYTIDGEKMTIAISVGTALSPDHGIDADTLLAHADIALNHAKRSSKRRQVFSPELGLTAGESAALEQGVRAALGTAQFFMEYQPIVEIQSGTPLSLEALVRWRHPEFGLIQPSAFVPVIERCQLMEQFGAQILTTVLADMKSWVDRGLGLIPVAVNVDPYQLEHTDYAGTVRRLASEHRIDPKFLTFEITETTFLSDTAKVVETLQTLRGAGSNIYIDDFGTGYSGLSYLSHLPVDGLKVDQGFMRDILTNPAKLPIVKAILDLAHSLRLRVVAEGVETAEQLVLLSEVGCDCAQGYFLGRPVIATDCVPLLTKLAHPDQAFESAVVAARNSDVAQVRGTGT
jgi:diguanylate cyclase (GGDEF)-like protein